MGWESKEYTKEEKIILLSNRKTNKHYTRGKLSHSSTMSQELAGRGKKKSKHVNSIVQSAPLKIPSVWW